jgi:spermidine synthase
MISAKLLNNFAFVVISLTMLGFAVSGALLTPLLDRVLPRRDDVLLASASLFGLTALFAGACLYRADLGGQIVPTREAFVIALLQWMPVALLFAVPFACAGLILGTLLASPDLPTRRVYFVDLVGSGLGAILVIPAIAVLGVELSLVLACALLLAGALWLLPGAGHGSRVLAALSAAALVGAALAPGRVFAMRYPRGSMLSAEHMLQVEHVAWDPLARIEVARVAFPLDPDQQAHPGLLGTNRAFLARFRRLLTQNNYAYTFAVDYDGTPGALVGIEETMYAAAYAVRAVPRPRVAIIGVGGGFDVLTALRFDASSITGIEINAATLRILRGTYRDYFRHWVDDPRVRLVHGDGRHVLARSEERFDVIQLSGVDSYSGTPGAANVFSENYLYTAEAFDVYLRRLTDGGVLNMMRVEMMPPREMLRALATAVQALRRAGVAHPAAHVMLVTERHANFTALLVKKTPFSAEEQARLGAWAGASPYFRVSAGPGPVKEPVQAFEAYLRLDDPGRERVFARLYPFDIRPSTDDWPFFFHHSRWSHTFGSGFGFEPDVAAVEITVVLLLVIVGGMAVACVTLPLRLSRVAAPGARSASWRSTVYFAGAGIGYLAIEVALMQKFGVFLGHPNYALSVVLAVLLFASGLGSMASAAVVKRLGALRFVSYVLAALMLLEYALAFPHLLSLIAAPFLVRVAIVALLVAPLGFCLGVYLPTGLEALKRTLPAQVPWAWGVNGIFSVIAPVLAAAYSMTWGIDALFLAALVVYLMVGWAHRDPDALSA